MVGASGFEIRLERVGESLQITSPMPTFRYGIVEKQLASVGVPPCEDGFRRSSASISRDLTAGNLPNQACELPMDAFVRRIAFSL
jgi:hypothetical protein